jgi:hypothetical protein
MSNPTLTRASEIADSAQGRAVSFVPTNQRATSGALPLSVQTDVPTFPGTPALTVSGTWTVAGTRVTATGIALVNIASVGIGLTTVPASSGPLQIVPGNSRVLIAF